MAEGIKVELLSKLIDSVPVLLILLGVLLFSLGLAGGVTYNNWFPIPESEARIGAAVAGCFIFGLGAFNWRTRGIVPKARSCGIKIDHPRDGDHVDIVDVRGSIKKAPSEGYTLNIFRIYPKSNSYAPIGDGRITIDQGTWEAERCNIGGKAGDKRYIGAYLVGPGGTALLDYYTKAAREHKTLMNQLRDLTGEEGKYLPLIEKRTPDMVECDRVSVQRKKS